MDPITVTWNGESTVEQAVETPDGAMTAAEFAAAFADGHGLHKAEWGVGRGTWGFLLDGEDVPDDAPVGMLGGETVELRLMVDMAADAGPDEDEVQPHDVPPAKAKRARKSTAG